MLQKIFLLVAVTGIATCSEKQEPKAAVKKTSPAAVNTAAVKKDAVHTRIKKYAVDLKLYAGKKYQTGYCFLIDMKKQSGENRFYVYDFGKNKVVSEGLVTHGNCGQLFLPKPKYGNTVGCNCSSLGKYSIGKKYYGRFGLAYKLHGLETTNSKAFDRFVVLHSHSCVPDEEVEPMPICQSNGCPTVSPSYLQTLAAYIDKSSKPVLLWMFE
jgi:hypothetical protein